MSHILSAVKGTATDEVRFVAEKEGMPIEAMLERVSRGKIAILKNKNHNISPVGIGEGLSVKINSNIGSSEDKPNIEDELKKLMVSIGYKADVVMDLSTGGTIDRIRKEILGNSTVPVGTVPIYQSVVNSVRKHRSMFKLTVDEMFDTIGEQAEQGVDFMTIHSGVTRESVERFKRQGRLLDVVSRGGALMMEWMEYNDKENPFFEHYDRLVEILERYDVVISLGDGLRPGALADATDRGQVQELIILGELARYAVERGVGVMIEGPGHVPIDQIETNIKLEKRLCDGAPFYVLGPLVTDIAPGYDHITSAIGGAIAGMAGADFLCYVTPAEHLRLPDIEDVKQGIIAARIAAHAADIARGVKGALDWDIKMAKARKAMDWESQYRLAIDPQKAREYRESVSLQDTDVCSMCGEFCPIKLQHAELKRVRNMV
ncbi:MAG: phosphomethylpyrimidine synthase ThiC [Deltaproteobacteria bacterium]|nr:phosphomethylpyrimidine synthase ThiC [Deltaproteobacteria bacterium]MCL5277601.1 phosphomethylpyrimidine synthase ThiC [Deltaproteobacteria bacterium]